MSRVGLKTKSPGQLVENHFVTFRGHIFSSILMKLNQRVCLDDISGEF